MVYQSPTSYNNDKQAAKSQALEKTSSNFFREHKMKYSRSRRHSTGNRKRKNCGDQEWAFGSFFC